MRRIWLYVWPDGAYAGEQLLGLARYAGYDPREALRLSVAAHIAADAVACDRIASIAVRFFAR